MPDRDKARRNMTLMLAWVAMITIAFAVLAIRDEQRTDDAVEKAERAVAQLEGPGAQARVDADIRLAFLTCQFDNRQSIPLRDLIGDHPEVSVGPVPPILLDCVGEALSLPGVQRDDVLRVIREEGLRFPNFGDTRG